MPSFFESLFARLLRRLAEVVCRHPRWFTYPQFLLFALCVLYTVKGLKLDMNRDHLVEANSRHHRIYLRFRQEFPQPDDLVAVVQSGDSERNRQFIERLAARVKPETNIFEDVFYKANLATLGSKSLLLLPEPDLENLRQALRDNRPFLREFARATNLNSLFSLINAQFLNAANTGGTNAGAQFVVQAIPGLQRIVVQATRSLSLPGPPPPPGIEALLGAGEGAQEQEYLTFNHGQVYLLTTHARSADLTATAIVHLRRALEQTRAEVPGLNAGLTGGPVLDYDEMRQSQHDSIVASLVSLLLCSLIFIAAYGQVGRPLKAAVCLIIGLGYTMGFATLAVGHLNILTITFVPMLIGLAIDFGVHLISRYEEEMRRDGVKTEAIHKAMVFTGQGIVTGALTTAAAFFAMALTDFKGIREMGVISGSGLILCLVPMLTLLAVLLLHGPQNGIDRSKGVAGNRRTRIETFWLRRPAITVVLTLALCAAAVPQFHRVHFDYNLLHMQSKGLPAVTFEELLIHSASQSTLFCTVLADNPQQAHDYEIKLKKLPAVAGVESVADNFIEDQGNKLRLARAIKNEVADIRFAPVDRRPVNVEELSPTLWYLTGFLGLATAAAQPTEPALAGQLRSLRDSVIDFRKAILNAQPQIPGQLAAFQAALFDELDGTFAAIKNQDTSGPMRPRDLPPALHDRFIGVTGKFLLQVYPGKDIWQRSNQSEFISQLQSVIPEDKLDGTPFELYYYTGQLKESYELAAGYALIAIIIMVLLHFRSLVHVVLALLPVAIGTMWLVGFMGLAGISFNPANIMTLPLVIGIGVTNGVQILNRFAEDGQPAIFGKSTGKAVLVSGLTAATGFGSLILGRHQGIQSLGEVMSIGIAGCMIAALTFLPALLTILAGRGWTVPLPQGLNVHLFRFKPRASNARH